MSVMLRFTEREKSFQSLPNLENLKARHNSRAVELRRSKRTELLQKNRAIIPNSRFSIDENHLSRELYSIRSSLFNTALSEEYRLSILFKLILESQDVSELFQGIQSLRQILGDNCDFPFVDLAINSQIISKLVCLHKTDELKEECIWTLLNFSAGPQRLTKEMGRLGVIDILIDLLQNESETTSEMCMWCLGNLAFDSLDLRHAIIIKGGITTILKMIESGPRIPVLSTCLWTLRHICKGTSYPEHSRLVFNCILRYVNHFDAKILADSLWILHYITENDSNFLIDLQDSLPKIVTLIAHPAKEVNTAVIKIVGNYTEGELYHLEMLFEHDIVNMLALHMPGKNNRVSEDVLWCMSNILGSSKDHARAVIDHPCLKYIVNSLEDPAIEVNSEALCAIEKMCSVISNEDAYIIDESYHLLQSILILLDKSDFECTMHCLIVLKSLIDIGKQDLEQFGFNRLAIKFEELGGLSKLEVLLNYPSNDVYILAKDILSFNKIT